MDRFTFHFFDYQSLKWDSECANHFCNCTDSELHQNWNSWFSKEVNISQLNLRYIFAGICGGHCGRQTPQKELSAARHKKGLLRPFTIVFYLGFITFNKYFCWDCHKSLKCVTHSEFVVSSSINQSILIIWSKNVQVMYAPSKPGDQPSVEVKNLKK